MNMPYTAVSVSGAGKFFPVAMRAQANARQALEGMLRAPFRSSPESSGFGDREGFWALRDISFDVQQGEIVGVVGHNGAGKSVLLKILARVTRPTVGRIEIRGTVAPLLEVGTGFHPDLTGRENIFLNGVILGMKRDEVNRRLDRIVAFADIGHFLDMPIRKYSTGMRMRLAFGVAAHLDRDIFLLDEVLAVGDHDFQTKCLARLRELASEGRTILLVSHGNEVVEQLCSRAILLHRGSLVASGSPAEVQRAYRNLSGRARKQSSGNRFATR